MTVKELRAALLGLEQDTDILLSSDPEGNSYHSLTERCIGEAVYNSDKYGFNVMNPDEVDEEDVVKPCYIIYP